MKEIEAKLLKSVKNKLRITWDYQDETIQEMMYEGIAFLQSRAGKLPFFDADTETDVYRLSIKLLKEYCRYDWSGAISSFETDYLSDILNLQITVATEAFKP
ncbi:hypothetical protein [Listeria booriae]|uniref:hypothetical protein n=1 Tax=Listeria booriae TaxID=1552123 RepID=UPI001627683B|nr:hypothetical protein [Listeria booriae]MBC2106144.1 hypothetical protein [Listeria booriae]